MERKGLSNEQIKMLGDVIEKARAHMRNEDDGFSTTSSYRNDAPVLFEQHRKRADFVMKFTYAGVRFVVMQVGESFIGWGCVDGTLIEFGFEFDSEGWRPFFVYDMDRPTR